MTTAMPYVNVSTVIRPRLSGPITLSTLPISVSTWDVADLAVNDGDLSVHNGPISVSTWPISLSTMRRSVRPRWADPRTEWQHTLDPAQGRDGLMTKLAPKTHLRLGQQIGAVPLDEFLPRTELVTETWATAIAGILLVGAVSGQLQDCNRLLVHPGCEAALAPLRATITGIA